MDWVQEMFGWMDGMAWRVEIDTSGHINTTIATSPKYFCQNLEIIVWLCFAQQLSTPWSDRAEKQKIAKKVFPPEIITKNLSFAKHFLFHIKFLWSPILIMKTDFISIHTAADCWFCCCWFYSLIIWRYDFLNPIHQYWDRSECH